MDHLESCGEQNVFKREFDKLDAGNGVVLIRDMPGLIEGALGRETRPWIRDRILKMFEANRDGKISWLDLQDGLRKAVGATRSDVLYREQQIPEWLVFNRKVSAHVFLIIYTCIIGQAKYGGTVRATDHFRIRDRNGLC